jgi:glycolate oxidase iron-sulfur subunit
MSSPQVAFSEIDVDVCYTCGLCSASCPIKRLVDPEFDPRKFVRSVVLGKEEKLLESFKIWLCLLCGTCTYNCPRGVKPSDLLALLRDKAIRDKKYKVDLVKKAAYGLIEKRGYLEQAVGLFSRFQSPFLLGLLKGLPLIPQGGKAFLDLIKPLNVPLRKSLPERLTAKGKPVYKVAYFLGCANDVVYGEIGKATVKVLALNGCEVFIPKETVCCGMPYLGYTDLERAKKLAKRNIEVLEKIGVDFVITDCATCGAFLRRYKELLSDDPAYSLRASRLSKMVYDVSYFLMEVLKLKEKPKGNLNLQVTYHDPCHLKKEQKVKDEPRELIKSINGVQFIEMPESDLCCGGAGTYGIFHFEESMKVLNRKMECLKSTGVKVLVSGCPGCITQFKFGVNREGLDLLVKHPVELLCEVYGLS